jgi:LysM repeat protein
MILIDKSVQRLLEVHALRRGEDPVWLKSLFHGDGSPYSSLIKHVPGHQAHMHVRFSSPVARRRGKDAYPTLVEQGHIKLKQEQVKHRVVRGDTLIGISRRYNTRASELSRLNQLTSTKIRVGQTLLIRKPQHLRGALAPILVPKRRLPDSYTPKTRSAKLVTTNEKQRTGSNE